MIVMSTWHATKNNPTTVKARALARSMRSVDDHQSSTESPSNATSRKACGSRHLRKISRTTKRRCMRRARSTSAWQRSATDPADRSERGGQRAAANGCLVATRRPGLSGKQGTCTRQGRARRTAAIDADVCPSATANRRPLPGNRGFPRIGPFYRLSNLPFVTLANTECHVLAVDISLHRVFEGFHRRTRLQHGRKPIEVPHFRCE
jgi:hypothetical protein